MTAVSISTWYPDCSPLRIGTGKERKFSGRRSLAGGEGVAEGYVSAARYIEACVLPLVAAPWLRATRLRTCGPPDRRTVSRNRCVGKDAPGAGGQRRRHQRKEQDLAPPPFSTTRHRR